ncbi:MAG: hypothetical protein IT581_18215 [Verrucomicrobiales bacterium]|nr:hypothetical protein [Verrucomicrobiales bacterium]
MNWFCGRTSAARLGMAGLTAVACLLIGCGKEEKAVPVASAEVKGEPIRGEPIGQAPTAPKPAEPVAAPTTPPTPTAPAIAKAGPTPESKPPAVAAPVAVASTQVASTSAADAKAGLAAGTGTVESPLVVGFDKLASFKYDLPDGQVDTNTVAQTGAANQIPPPIKALNNQFISLKGFMLPLKVEKGLVTEMLMMRDQSMCCYGAVPRINEWVSVKMVGAGVKPIMDQAVTLFGKLKVGEMYENGYLVGIYSLDGERMAGPLDM